MARTGRKPLAAGHVDRLQGSAHARQRMRLLLECMWGEKTIPEARTELDICEARFHTLRHQRLQEALELLEPRRTGRRCKQPARAELQQRVSRLESENQQLTHQLREARVQLIAAESGAKWRVENGAWKKSGEFIPDLPVGIHTIEFQDLGGWIKPESQKVMIEGGQTHTINGFYNNR